MAQFHKWDIESIENIYPFERDIYIQLIEDSVNTDRASSKAAPLEQNEFKEFLSKRKSKKT